MTGNDARQKLHVSTAKRTPEAKSKESVKERASGREGEQLMMPLASPDLDCLSGIDCSVASISRDKKR